MNFKETLYAIVLLTLLMSINACNTPKKAVSQNPQKTQKANPHFEGKIIYDLTFEDKKGLMSREEAKMFMGDQQVYTIKGNKYKSEMNGMMKMTQFYLGQDTLYNLIRGMSNLLWIDATFNPDEIVDFEITENADTINGVSCDLLTIKSKEGTTKYYFNKKFGIDPADYKNHEYGFWKFCIEKTNALPLKSTTDEEDVFVEIVFKEIQEMEVGMAEFRLPDLPRVESPDK